MRSSPDQYDAWVDETRERDSVTELYVREVHAPPGYDVDPVIPPPAPRFAPQVRSYTVPLQVPVAQIPPIMQTPVRRSLPPRRSLIGIGFGAACVLVGILIGGVIALTGSMKASATPARPHAVVVAPVPVVAPIPVAAPAPAKPARLTVRIESDPAGANATLIDNGNTSPIGITPLETDLDPTRTYDVVFTLDGHQTRVAHIDPARAKAVSVSLTADAPKRPSSPLETPPNHPPAAVAPPMGTLEVSTKPACSIEVDGRTTGLVTPQHALPLSPGRHVITLTNANEGVHLTADVDIADDQTTRLIRDFTK